MITKVNGLILLYMFFTSIITELEAVGTCKNAKNDKTLEDAATGPESLSNNQERPSPDAKIYGKNTSENGSSSETRSEMKKGLNIKNNILQAADEPINPYTHELGQVFLNKFDANPNHVWQIDSKTGRKTTYAEIKENTIRCALWMQTQNIGKNDIISICSPSHEDIYIPFLAIFYVGAVYNAWEPYISLELAQHYMKLTKPKIIFVAESDAGVIKQAATLENHEVKIIVFGKYREMQSLEETLRLQNRTDVQNFQCVSIENPKTLAAIQFSSGTSGVYKGAAFTYEKFARIAANGKLFSGGQGTVGLWYSPLSWITGTCSMLQSIMHDTTRIIHASFDPEETCKVIEKFQVNWAFLAPRMLAHLVKSNVLKNYELKSFKKLLTGGIRVRHDVIYHIKENLPHMKLINSYGMSETGTSLTAQNEHTKKIDSVGFIMPHVQLKIIDVNNAILLGPNQPGELCFKSATMTDGYYNNPKVTQETIDHEGWLHSGDLGYYDENGEVFIIDRLKELINNRGYQVAPSEIGEILMRHPDVIEATAVAKPHEHYIEEAMAFVEKSPTSEVSEQDLVNLSFQCGNEKKLWGGVKFLESLPYLSTGKVDRKSLKELAKSYVT